MNDFSHSHIRWESMASPQRTFCCILNALIEVLATVANTATDSKKRAEAIASLDAMTEESVFRSALSGDFGEVCLLTLRKWEPIDRDPSAEMRDVKKLTQQLRRSFLDGNVLCAAPAEPRSDARAPLRTLTQISHEQLKSGIQVRYGHKLLVLQTRSRRQVFVEAMSVMAVATDANIYRLNAEFCNIELRTYLDAFDVDNYKLPMLNLLDGATPAEGGNERRRLLELLVH